MRSCLTVSALAIGNSICTPFVRTIALLMNAGKSVFIVNKAIAAKRLEYMATTESYEPLVAKIALVDEFHDKFIEVVTRAVADAQAVEQTFEMQYQKLELEPKWRPQDATRKDGPEGPQAEERQKDAGLREASRSRPRGAGCVGGGGEGKCSLQQNCCIKDPVGRIYTGIRELLEGMSVADLLANGHPSTGGALRSMPVHAAPVRQNCLREGENGSAERV